MKDYKIKNETILALGAVCCLLYMRYYEIVIYYRTINIMLDTFYNYIAIPFFYFFVSACFMTILVNLFKIQVSQKTKRIYKMIDIVMATSYVLFLVLKMAGVIAIGNYPFISLYWTIFIAWGFIFTIDINSQIKESI